MADDKKYDDETQKFYDENKDMIDRILAGGKECPSDGSEKAYLEEVLRRAAFERRMRMEYEAERARREAFDKAERVYGDIKYGCGRAGEAFDESRERLRDRFRRETDYLSDMLETEGDRFRDGTRRAKDYAKSRFDEDMAHMRESRDKAKAIFNESLNEYVAPFSDAQFQRHLFGAGIELWMAFNAFVRSAPLPDAIKHAFVEADENRNAEWCRKSPSCRAKEETKAEHESEDVQKRKIQITPLKKGDE